ncbi:MAG: DUF3035 domain-containing protein, partial [Pseudomonadota bacterium]
MPIVRRPLLVATVALATALAGCDKVGDPIEALGGRRPAPDEFAVIARAPLVVPQDVRAGEGGARSLPRPDPGRRSPLEPDPGQQARNALLGAGGTAPEADLANPPDPVVGVTQSRGEQVLSGTAVATAAGADGAEAPDIRTQLEQDRAAEAAAQASGPYEAPSLVELLGFDGDEEQVDPDTVIDPVAESQRLQREGFRAPNDPEATVAEEPSSNFRTGP